MPVYNTEKYLKRCLDSLVNQTFKEIEVICVNDASPDNSIKILNEYKEKYPEKVYVIDSKINLRQGGARNLGLDIAKGEYIAFLDSDDWVELNMYEKMYQRIEGKKNAIVYCDYYETEGLEKEKKIILRKEHVDFEKSIDDIRKTLLISPCSIWAGLYSKELFQEKNIRFPEKIFYEDNYLVPLLVLEAENIVELKEPLLNYFVGNESTTRSYNSENTYDRIKSAELLYNKLVELDKLEKYYSELEFYFLEIYYVRTSVMLIVKFFPIRFKTIMELREKIKIFFPNFKKNKYFQQKIKKKPVYGAYFYVLNYTPYFLKVLFNPRALLARMKRKYGC